MGLVRLPSLTAWRSSTRPSWTLALPDQPCRAERALGVGSAHESLPAVMTLCGSARRSVSVAWRKEPVRAKLVPLSLNCTDTASFSRFCFFSRQMAKAQPTAWLSRSPCSTNEHQHIMTVSLRETRGSREFHCVSSQLATPHSCEKFVLKIRKRKKYRHEKQSPRKTRIITRPRSRCS